MEENKITDSRRDFLKVSAGTGLAALGSVVSAQSFDFKPNQRYPDPAVQILDPSFGRYRIFSSKRRAVRDRHALGRRAGLVRRRPLPAGQRHSEQPHHALGRSHRPGERVPPAVELLERPGARPQGRLLACEHLTRRVTRTEYDGTITVLADSFDGKRLNSPNDIVCKSDGSIWFTDPPFGIGGN